jgi:hypothetical protein
MYAYITISNVGGDAGPFDLYSNLDGYISAFETDVPKASLEAGYATANVPDGTTIIKIQSKNDLCNNFVNVGTSPLIYYFEPNNGSTYMADFSNSGTYTYVYGYWTGYFDGNESIPGNHIVKLNPDRSVDRTFDIDQGPNFHTVFLGATMAELPDLSTIFVGYFTSFNGVTVNRILKLLPNGERDPSFNTGSGFNDYTTSIKRDTSGRLYITGKYELYNGVSSLRLIRLLSDGSVDTSYNVGSGFNNSTVFSLLNSDNSIYISGYFTTYKGVGTPVGIVKLDANANVDSSFDGGSGFNVGNNQPISLARIGNEDSFFAAGYFTTYKGVSEPYIMKIKPNGDKDTDFDAGTGFNNAVGSVKIVWEDKLFITGFFTSYNGTSSVSYIILNKDGTVFLNFPTSYTNMYIVGNELFATEQVVPYYNEKIYEYDPSITTTTTTTV